MSASMVRKSLAIVDEDFCPTKAKSKDSVKKKNKTIQRGPNIEIVGTQRKTTITEARKKCKSKEERLKENLQKLKLIREVCAVNLDKEVTSQIIERAVTKRPVKVRTDEGEKDQKTAFTEEDFAKFEAEYFHK